MDNIFDDYDYEKEYDCDQYIKCNHFSKIMFLIIKINSIPNGYTLLKDYVISNKNEINNKNSEEWTSDSLKFHFKLSRRLRQDCFTHRS